MQVDQASRFGGNGDTLKRNVIFMWSNRLFHKWFVWRKIVTNKKFFSDNLLQKVYMIQVD